MVHKENLFDGDLIAGIITALIVMILFSIYAIISPKPASARKQVFRPYPAISPKDIPDAPLGNQKCFSESIPCPGPSSTPSPGNYCESKCGGGTTFKCTKPGEKTKYKGIVLDPNTHYCLPKTESSFNNDDAASTVNPNTGAWEWVDDPDYCATLGDNAVGNQCWKPRCLYPNLFANENGGCNDFVGCRPPLGGNQSVLRLTYAGATELVNAKIINNTYTVDEVTGLLFDPIRVWSSDTGDTRGIADDVIKTKSTGQITTGNVITETNYNALISEGPYKTTSSGDPYWACACGNSFDTDLSSGICSVNSTAGNAPWGICESHADKISCNNDTSCIFREPSNIFRPPDNPYSCQTDFCAATNSEYSLDNMPRMITTDLFKKPSPSSPGSPGVPYCACRIDESAGVYSRDSCQDATQTIIPYGRLKGMIGSNPCTTMGPQGEIPAYLIKTDSNGLVRDMSDFSNGDDDYTVQCCMNNYNSGGIKIGDKLGDNCEPPQSGLFTRYCLSRNHRDKINDKCPDNTTLQPDSCVIRESGPGGPIGYCASTLGVSGHANSDSKKCKQDSDCDQVCYTEIVSGKYWDKSKPAINTKWKNAHNCDAGTNNAVGLEAVLPCELNHCEANCYDSSSMQCVSIHRDENNLSSTPSSPACNSYTSREACEAHPDDCRYIRGFGNACNKIQITDSCGKDSEGMLCQASPGIAHSGTCMNYNGELKCVSCDCAEALETSPVCIGLDADGKTCSNDNDCGPASDSQTKWGETYDIQDKFCDIPLGKSQGTCKSWGFCSVNLDTDSGVVATPAGSNVCEQGAKSGESCGTNAEKCRPCSECNPTTNKCVSPSDPGLASDCDSPARQTKNKCTGAAADGVLGKNCVWKENQNKCTFLLKADPEKVCIADSPTGYRCNTNRNLALYPATSWMDESAPRGVDIYPSYGESPPVEVPKNRIKPPKDNDAFRCRNDQGCLGFVPQAASELPKSVKLAYTNHPKAALITPYGVGDKWLNSSINFPPAPKLCKSDDDCSGGVCTLKGKVEKGNPKGICISSNFSSWEGNNGTTYMEPSFWDGTGGDTWALQMTTCGGENPTKDGCPPNIAWCNKGGGDSDKTSAALLFGCDGCTNNSEYGGEYNDSGSSAQPDASGRRIITKNPLTGEDITNDAEAAAACVTYYSQKCFPPIRMDSSTGKQPIPQVLGFKSTKDGAKGVMNITPCLADGADPYWNDQIGFNATWGRDTSKKYSEQDINSLFTAGQSGNVRCCSNPNNESAQRRFQEGSSGGCIGGSTVLETKRGKRKVLDLRVGDFVKTGNGWSKIFYIRNHGVTKIKHLKFIFEEGDEFIITEDHLVFDVNRNLKRADNLQIGERIWGSNKKIRKIINVLDIPLTPCVVEGEIFVNGFLISCWAQSKENADKMMQLMKIVEKYMGDMNEKELETLSHSFYEKFKASGKNLDTLVK